VISNRTTSVLIEAEFSRSLISIARVVPCGDEEAEDDSRDAVLYQASSLARKKKKAEDVTFLMTQRVGSPRYMAPEVARQESYNLKADVYSFAVLVHQIFTLEKPYEDISDEDYDECVFYKGVRPNIPSGLPFPTKNLLRRAWSHRISQRPNMEAVREALIEQRSEILRLGTIGRILPPTAGFGSTAYVASCAFESVSDNSKKLKPAKNTRSSGKKSSGKKSSGKKSSGKKSTSNLEPPKNTKTKQKGLLSNLFKNKTKKVQPPGVSVSETSGGHRRRRATARAA
jgi:serine/threonine protein kinase